MGEYEDIIKKCAKDWACPELMESVNKVGGRKIPFSSPSLNYATYGGVPRGALSVFYGVPSGGKAQPLYSKILTPKGFITMGDVKVGDTIFDGRGNLCKVTEIFPQGVRDIYEITTCGNNKIRVADNHLNSVWRYNRHKKCREDFVWDTKTLIEQFNAQRERKSLRIDIPTVDFPHQDVPIDPYLFGALLGDGSLQGNFEFTNPELDLIDKINSLLSLYQCELHNDNGDNLGWRVRVQKEHYVPGKKMYLHKTLEDLGVRVKSIDKHIPDIYLYNSYDVRLKLLQGLFDTDGSITAEGKVEFATSSKQLSEDFAFLVRTFGIRDAVNVSTGKYRDASGSIIECHTRYRHHLKIPNGFPFFTSKKHSARYKARKNPPYRPILSIEYVGKEECQCIMVDSPEHTYISDDFLITHNTTSAVDVCKNALEIFNQEYTDEIAKLEKQVAEGKKEAKIALQDLRDRGPKKILYVDIEHTFDKKWAAKLGIAYSAIDIMQTPNVSAEKILQALLELIETGTVGLMVLDSVPSLVPQAKLDKKLGERTVAPLAGLMSDFTVMINQMLLRYDCTMIYINQLRANMVNPFADNTPGGEAIKFYSSLNLKFVIGSPLDFLGNEIPQKSENPAGYKISVYIKKTKACPRDRTLAEYYLMAQSGLRVDFEYVHLATEKYNIIIKNKAWFTICDPETREPLETEDGIVKVNGMPKVYDYMQSHPDFYAKMCEYITNDINKNGLELSGSDVVDE